MRLPIGAEGFSEMKLHTITLQSIKRRKAKSLFLALGIILSVGSVVTLINVGNNVNKSIAEHLDEFGANIIVTPRTTRLILIMPVSIFPALHIKKMN